MNVSKNESKNESVTTRLLEKPKPSLALSHILIILCYDTAFMAALFTYRHLAAQILQNLSPVSGQILRIFISDAAATVVVFLFSLACNNSSIYDPYWSAAVPLVFLAFLPAPEATRTAGFFQTIAQFPTATLLFLVVVLFWSIRLTLNCAIHWKGLSDEDWRYSSFRSSGTLRYWLVSFAGFHFMPTVLVFAASCPAFFILNSPVTNPVYATVGLVITAGAVLLETIADLQMDRFKKTPDLSHDAVCTLGLWGISRHPNYLGEITFWWGIWLTSLGFEGAPFFLILAPVAVTILFLAYSIPSMERRQLSSRPEYARIQKTVPMLLPIRHSR